MAQVQHASNVLQNSCPFCDRTTTIAFQKPPFTIFDCQPCSHRFCNLPENETHVQDVYGDDYFNSGGGGYDDYLLKKDLLIHHGKKYAAVLERYRKTADRKILDIGCAAGFLLKGFQDKGWDGVGIDPNHSMIKHGIQEFGLDLRHQSIEEFAQMGEGPKGSKQDSPKVDAAVMVQVLPHIADPVSAINAVSSTLNEQGLLLIETWNWQSLTARAFNKKWHEYNPPSVLHWFSKSGLRKLLSDSGFEVVAQGRPTKWISIGNGVSLIRHSLRDSTLGRFAAAPLGLIPKSLKAPYFLDDVFWMVARKR
ncbi:class I SAM-dependent methyltransferase [Mariniblastus sp.]|nr:class I SAM-dependent methyltransferase [Mariniblastus sp.]